MADINEILNSTESSGAYYDPSQDLDGIVPIGDYYAHICGLDVRKDVIVRGKFLADIYVPSFKVAKENATNDYGTNGEDVSGKAFVGREIKAKGFFRFKNPDKAKYPQLSDSQGSNKRYMEFVESAGVKVAEDKDGKYRLPEIREDDIYGKPVIAKVIHDKWLNDDGEEKASPKVLSVFNWAEGKREMIDVPF